MSYIPYATSSKDQTGDITTYAQFEEGGLLSETRDDKESGNESDEYSTFAPLNSEEEMDMMSSDDEFDAESMTTDMLEDIRDVSQSHPIINRREARYKIRNCFKQSRAK